MNPTALSQLTAPEIDEIYSKAKQGDPGSLRTFLEYAVWRAIEKNQSIAQDIKEMSFFQVMNLVEIKVETHG